MLSTATCHSQPQQTDPKEGLHRATDMMRKFSKGDWVFGRCLVSDLDLPLEFIVPRPLICAKNRQSGFYTTTRGQRSHTAIRICVVVFPPSCASILASRRVWKRPLIASSRESPRMPSFCVKKIGICNTASTT